MVKATKIRQVRKEIYFSRNINEVLRELKSRTDNRNIDEILHKYWDHHEIPYMDFLHGGPYAVLSRSVATPNLEQLRFLKLANIYKLKPIILEYDGKFVTKNLEKFCLCKLHFFIDKNKREYRNPIKISIADTNKYQGKNMSEIATYGNKSLRDFHHNLFWKYSNPKTCSIYDFTDWFNKTRTLEGYYFFFLLIFIKNAVLFDNYLLSDKFESGFVEQKILPSIDMISKIFNLKPLVFPLLPFKSEGSTKWLSYDHQIEDLIEKNLGDNL